MLSKLIKISLVFILLPECLLGQKIYTSIERVNGSALETSRFYVSKRDANGNDIIKTEAIFPNVLELAMTMDLSMWLHLLKRENTFQLER